MGRPLRFFFGKEEQITDSHLLIVDKISSKFSMKYDDSSMKKAYTLSGSVCGYWLNTLYKITSLRNNKHSVK